MIPLKRGDGNADFADCPDCADWEEGTGQSVFGARDPQTYAIIGAAMEVHKRFGAGFLEAAYKEALAIEFELRGIPFKREVRIAIYYRDRLLDCTYRADFVCYEDVIVEAKAIKQLSPADRAQLLNYLKATRVPKGLLLNFGAESLEFERVVLTPTASIDPLRSSSAQSGSSAKSAFPSPRFPFSAAALPSGAR